ncbi:MAG: hypothetical protein ACREQ2_00465 [Candidatus Binatia bacterium]
MSHKEADACGLQAWIAGAAQSIGTGSVDSCFELLENPAKRYDDINTRDAIVRTEKNATIDTIAGETNER